MTISGEVFCRTKITSETPFGLEWSQVENENYSFCKITCNSKFVYALDVNGYVYLKNDSKLDKSGTNNWVRVLKGLSNISISLSNKVFQYYYCLFLTYFNFKSFQLLFYNSSCGHWVQIKERSTLDPN